MQLNPMQAQQLLTLLQAAQQGAGQVFFNTGSSGQSIDIGGLLGLAGNAILGCLTAQQQIADLQQRLASCQCQLRAEIRLRTEGIGSPPCG
ncbi:MAG: hypothetical protein ACM3XM_11265 [Mycobacterium leprae]